MNRGTLTPIWELAIGDTVLTQTKDPKEVEVKEIKRTGSKRITWHITWSDGTKTTHSKSAIFRIV